MENLGTLAILVAFCLAVYSAVASLVAYKAKNQFLQVSAERSTYATWFLLTVAGGLLLNALMQDDFRLSYVAQRSNRAMEWYYKLAAWWGGQEGSLLFWNWILATYTVVVAWMNRFKFRAMMPIVLFILAATQAFFLSLIVFEAQPFQVLTQGGPTPIAVPDGNGLNPLLQYWSMVIHPPFLYLGFVGFIVPFAFAMGHLVTKTPGDAWIHTTRRWSLVTWMFQTTGIILGAGWAYVVLGWGGYWAWDPVENASFLPWLTATAFLHSVMMQEKKGMMKVWNMVLVSSTFFLCIFGTFLTRSGLVSSVHAFASSPVGPYFVWYLAIGVTATILLIVSRLDYLKTEQSLESVLSRESAFMFNNLVLVASCFSILWGTLFPKISEYVKNEVVSVGAPYFNKINIPLGLLLLFLTGVGPLIAWRRSSFEALKKAFLWPTILATLGTAALFVGGMRHVYALISLFLCMFVTGTILSEFIKGAGAIATKESLSWVRGVVELTHRNTRRYGGYIVHLGIVAMFVGFTGAAFNQSNFVEVGEGAEFPIAAYQVKVDKVVAGENENYSFIRSNLTVNKDGQFFANLNPERRVYKSQRQSTGEVAVHRTLSEDLYINFAGPSNDQNVNRFVIQAYTFPLVSWVWIGFWVVLFGSIICLIPAKTKLIYAKTEIVAQEGAAASEASLVR
jgi:cytochrome c-type biogenesis protein CcmF